MDITTERAIFDQVRRCVPGAFLWRTKTDSAGEPREELLSEGGTRSVLDACFCLKQAGQPPRLFTHEDLTGQGEAYLLISKAKQGIRFAFQHRSLVCTGEDVEFAAFTFRAYDDGANQIALSFFLWDEQEQTQFAFEGWDQQRLIDHVRGIQQLMLCLGGGHRD